MFVRSSPLTDLTRVRDVDLLLTNGRAFSANERREGGIPVTAPGRGDGEQVMNGATSTTDQR